MAGRRTAPARPKHPFQPESGVVDWRGTEMCGRFGCGLPRANTVHEMPDNPAAEHEARRYGEREDHDGQ